MDTLQSAGIEKIGKDCGENAVEHDQTGLRRRTCQSPSDIFQRNERDRPDRSKQKSIKGDGKAPVAPVEGEAPEDGIEGIAKPCAEAGDKTGQCQRTVSA